MPSTIYSNQWVNWSYLRISVSNHRLSFILLWSSIWRLWELFNPQVIEGYVNYHSTGEPRLHFHQIRLKLNVNQITRWIEIIKEVQSKHIKGRIRVGDRAMMYLQDNSRWKFPSTGGPSQRKNQLVASAVLQRLATTNCASGQVGRINRCVE